MIQHLENIRRGGPSKQIWGGGLLKTLSGEAQLKKHPVDIMTIIHAEPNNVPEYGYVLSTQKSIVSVDYGVVVGIK